MAQEIRKFLAFLSRFTKIDFTGKEAELGSLVQKYDKDKNSIFDSEELKAIKNDLSVFKNDENIEENVDSFVSNLTAIGRQNKEEIIKKHLDKIGNKRDFSPEDIEDLLDLDNDRLERAGELFYIENRKPQFTGIDIYYLMELNDEEYKRATELFYIESRKKQFCGAEIVELAKLNDEEFERAKTLFTVESKEKQFNGVDIAALAKLNDKQFESAKELFVIENREEQLDGSSISSLVRFGDEAIKHAQELFLIEDKENPLTNEHIVLFSKLGDKEFEHAKQLIPIIDKIEDEIVMQYLGDLVKLNDKDFKREKELIYAENRERQFDRFERNELEKLDDEQFERAKKLFTLEIRGRQVNGYEIAELAGLNDEELERAKELFTVENRKEQFNGCEIAALAKLNDEELERAKKLFTVENRKQQFDGRDIAALAKLNDEELERAKELFTVENRKYQFDGWDIAALAKLNNEELERAKGMFTVENREQQFNGVAIAKLAKLNDEEYERAKKLFNVKNGWRQFDSNEITKLAKLKDKDFQMVLEYLNDESNESSYNEAESGLMQLKVNKNMEIFMDENEIVETVEREDIPDVENMESCKNTKIYNKKLKVEHNIISGAMPNIDEKNVVSNEILKYYDDNGNVIRTVTLKRNPDNGVINVSETDKNGKQTPIQWESIDSDTGANITERHLTSPDGTKTDYYSEENEKLKVSDYKITDNEGNVLINVHQTFEQVSENKFISSILATDNPKDTQVYEIEYTENGTVKIFDKKNNETTEIDLNNYADSKETLEKLLPTIKQLPGQVLLEFAEKPFSLRYDNNDKANGYWNPNEKSELVIGSWEGSVDENKDLFATLLHELGHYLDLYKTTTGKFSKSEDILKISNEELDELYSSTTSMQQSYLEHFIVNYGILIKTQSMEKVAETHSLLYSKEDSSLNMRRLYLAQYFPRTIAAIMKELLKEEGVKV